MIKIVIMVILAVAAICLAEGIPLVKKNLWKELITFSLLMFISILLLAVRMLDIGTPIGMLDNLLSPVGRLIFKHD